MDWAEVFAIIGAIFIANCGVMIPMFLWIRSEANSDRREAAAERSADRKDILQLIRNIQEEMKDFHGRLCKIEERHASK